MNKFFTVSFKRELDDSNKDDIIDRFYSKLKEDWYNEISMIEDNRIIVTGDFFTLKLKAYGLLNAWTRIVKKAEVIVSGGSVTFTLDNSYGYISLLISGIFFFFLGGLIFQLGFTWRYLFYFVLIYSGISLVSISFMLFLQWRFFTSTIKYDKTRYIKQYDWEGIMKEKSLEDLKSIAYGRIISRPEVMEMAKMELKNREKG
jgi:hypothetical protein